MLQGFLRRTSCAFSVLQQDSPHCQRSHPASPPSNVSIFGDKLYPLVSCSPLCPCSALASPSRASCDPAWLDASMFARFLLARPYIPCARHAVKLWGRCYSTLWDQLLLEQQWKWVGHVLRMPPTSFVRNVLLNLIPSSRDAGSRRARTGPNNCGHRLLLRWLGHNGIDPSFASDRQAWNHLGNRWLARFGLCRNFFHHNTSHPCPEAHLPQDFRAIQGCFHGQQVFLVGCKPSGHWIFRELDRIEGWRQLSWQLSSDFEGFEVGLQQCLHAWCGNGTFHCRCLVHFFEVDLFFWNSLPARLKAIESRSLVCEISSIPNQWMDQLMPELELMLNSGWMCFFFLLVWARAPSVGTSDGARERMGPRKCVGYDGCKCLLISLLQLGWICRLYWGEISHVQLRDFPPLTVLQLLKSVLETQTIRPPSPNWQVWSLCQKWKLFQGQGLTSWSNDWIWENLLWGSTSHRM